MSAGSNQKVLDEIIDNVAGLPLESQDTILMVAKAMQYTRSCMARRAAEQSAVHPHKYSRQPSSSLPGA